uniref:Uncharacterized protein n=1 Tax=Avena sativa TaxID=4498 RepID=A0ACD5UF11_AVESA
MGGAVLVAVAAAIGNLLQGWDNATIAGAVLYIKEEFNLESEPLIEGLIVATSLIGATAVTTIAGGVADSIGRRPVLIASSVLYFVSGLVMLWAPTVYVLLLARLIDGLGIGLALTIVPLYISETAPTEIRGSLNTLPMFNATGGMFLSYCMVFGMSLLPKPNWRVMLGVLSIPSLVYFALAVFYLPESPRWLVSKGRMAKAKRVLQRLRGREDVSGELSLLVEGLGVGKDTRIEEYIIAPDEGLTPDTTEKIKLYGPEEGQTWVARPVSGQSALGSVYGFLSQHGSMASQGKPFMDNVVTLFDSVHEKTPNTFSSMRSTLIPNFGSMFSVAEQHAKADSDAEGQMEEGNEYGSNDGGDDDEESLLSPLISRQSTSVEGTPLGSIIGGGWQLAWKWTEREGADGQKEGGFQRIYFHGESVQGNKQGSILSLLGGDVPPAGSEFVQAAALVSRPALYSKKLLEHRAAGPAMVHPSEAVAKGPKWADLFAPGVKHALFVGIGIQILQQFAGINGVLYYTPQILEQAGVGVLVSNIGLSSSLASILISTLTTLLMLPSLGIAMRFMDMSGRRFLLLATIPILIVALVVLVMVNILDVGTTMHAALSTISIVLYFCFFVMGFGPIPNILCAEIFPTTVRGICIAICAFASWIGDITVTYTLPVMLNSIGLAGVFGICCFLYPGSSICIHEGTGDKRHAS